MSPEQIEKIQVEYSRRHPSIKFVKYLDEGTFSKTYAASNGIVPCVVKLSKQPISVSQAVDKERSAILNLLLEFNGHPHIASLQAVEEIDGHLVTQWEQGEMNLERRLQQCLQQGLDGIPRVELYEYMRQAADGLTQLNSKLVHRDIKPENLLLFCGQVKVIDFGFARLAEAEPVTNSVEGTLVYAPPEATDDRELNPSVDIYCLAATAIRLLTGKYPFGNSGDMKERKRECRFHREGLLPHEIAALELALHPNPSRRPFASANDFVKALTEPSAIPTSSAAAETTDQPQYTASVSLSTRYRDRIRAFLEHDDQRETKAQQDSKARVEQLWHEFYELLDQQLGAGEFVWAHGTAEALLRWTPNDKDLVAIRDRLQRVDPMSGHRRCCDILGQRFVLIPPGEFWMGSPINIGNPNEHPRHLVRITRPFYMSIYPVTVEQFQLFAAMSKLKNSEWAKPGIEQGPHHPVVNVNRDDMCAYCSFCTSKSSTVTYMLPTEAMWEYACRADTNTLHYAGDDEASLRKIAHFDAKSTAPVGKLKPNAFGLYDMLGNVWEQCHDFYDSSYYADPPCNDPTGPATGTSVCWRGGSWNYGSSYCRSGFRDYAGPSYRYHHNGFRVACLLRDSATDRQK